MPVDALSLNHDAVSGLMDLWSRIHWSTGDGMMPAEQMLAIYRLAVEWPVKGDVVELGSWVGLTTSYLATACRVRGDGFVYAVDTFKGSREGDSTYASVDRFDGDTHTAFQRQITRAKVTDLVRPLVGWTTEIADTYPGNPIRVLLIDADHSYEGVRKDYERWLPHVTPGGLIIFHDYLIADVARFVNETLPRRAEVDASPAGVVENVYAVTKHKTTNSSRSQPAATTRKKLEPAA